MNAVPGRTWGVYETVRSAEPYLLGADPWRTEELARRFFGVAHQDLLGRAVGQPLHRLFGGALREEVDYFYYLATAEGLWREADVWEVI